MKTSAVVTLAAATALLALSVRAEQWNLLQVPKDRFAGRSTIECPTPICPEPKCPDLPPVPPCPSCPACPGCRQANLSCPQPVCPPAVCPLPQCPRPECPATQVCPAGAGQAASCAGCQWKVLVTYDHFPGFGYYKAYKARVDWHQAKRLCEADGAHLGIINSQEEQELFKMLYQRYELGGWIHIGFNDLKIEGSYETVLGEPLSKTGYVNWRHGQPDNLGNEDCGTIDSNAHLNDGRCDWKIGYICEADERKVLGQ